MALELPPVDLNYEISALRAKGLKMPLWTEEHSGGTAKKQFYTPGYFAHHDPSDMGLVRFRHPKERGTFPFSLKNDFISVKPGKFLTEFFKDKLSAEEIAQIANAFRADALPPVIEWAVTADEIEHIYNVGPDSCMKKPGQWGKGMNPVRAYAGYDLALAYIKRRGKVTARAICCPDRKIYGRIYGDGDTLAKLLIAEKFTQKYSGDYDPWKGCKMSLIQVKDQVARSDGKSPVLMMPYGDMFKYAKLARDSNGDLCLEICGTGVKGFYGMPGAAVPEAIVGTPTPLHEIKV